MCGRIDNERTSGADVANSAGGLLCRLDSIRIKSCALNLSRWTVRSSKSR